MTKIIAVTNQKGGCGKTTSVISLASALTMRGYSCTVVDCDQQTNATQAFGIDAEELDEDQYTVLDAYLNKRPADQIEMSFPDRFGGRMFLVPGSRGVSTVQFRYDSHVNEQLASQEITHLDADLLKDDQRARLKSSLGALKGKRDFIFIDTGPELALLMTTALIAADHYLIPMNPSAFDLKGLKLLLKASGQIRERYQHNLSLLGVFLTRTKYTKLDSDVRELLQASLKPGDMLTAEIGDSVKHREATLYGLSIHEHAAGEAASTQYLAMADELLERMGNPTPLHGEKTLGSSDVHIADNLAVPNPSRQTPPIAAGQGDE